MGISPFMDRRKHFIELWSPNCSIFVVSPETAQEHQTTVNSASGSHAHVSISRTHGCLQLQLLFWKLEMSLFCFGITVANRSTMNKTEVTALATPSFLPQQTESGLGSNEYTNVTTAVSDLANPEHAAKKRRTRGKYVKYSDEQRAEIGRYASRGQEGIFLGTYRILQKAL